MQSLKNEVDLFPIRFEFKNFLKKKNIKKNKNCCFFLNLILKNKTNIQKKKIVFH